MNKSQLIEALACLSRADITLKTTGQNPRLVLESAIFRICGRFTPDAG